MALRVFKNVKLYLGQYDISGDTNQVQLGITTEGLPAVAGAAKARVEVPGLEVVKLTGKVFRQQNAAAMLTDDVLVDKRTVRDVPLVCGPLGAAAGDLVWFFKAALAQVDTGLVLGQLPMIDISAMATDAALVRGAVLENATRTGPGNGTAKQLGAVSAGQRVYAALCVLACSGGTLTVKLQSDNASGFASPTDVLTFTGVTGPGFEWREVAGAIADDWWREAHTLTAGSATFALFVGIL